MKLYLTKECPSEHWLPNDFLFHLLFQSSVSIFKFVNFITDKSLFPLESRFGDEERRLMHLVPAPAVRLWNVIKCQRILWAVRKCPWKIDCFLEDLFLGSQWSIILGYRRLSVKFLKS